MKTRQKSTKWESSRLNQPTLIPSSMMLAATTIKTLSIFAWWWTPLLGGAQPSSSPKASIFHEKKLKACQVECSEPQHATEGSKLNLPGGFPAYRAPWKIHIFEPQEWRWVVQMIFLFNWVIFLWFHHILDLLGVRTPLDKWDRCVISVISGTWRCHRFDTWSSPRAIDWPEE